MQIRSCFGFLFGAHDYELLYVSWLDAHLQISRPKLQHPDHSQAPKQGMAL
jgi:hypothetical protein